MFGLSSEALCYLLDLPYLVTDAVQSSVSSRMMETVCGGGGGGTINEVMLPIILPNSVMLKYTLQVVVYPHGLETKQMYPWFFLRTRRGWVMSDG